VRIGAGDVTDVMRTLHDDPQLRFELLADLAGVDTGTTMQVVYHLWSPLSPDWVRVIADGLSRDDPRVPSVTFLWLGAEWAEREAYDMFGIIFEGNRDLRRIYMPPDYESFPLRKDFLLADDAPRSPGMGVRPMEQMVQPAESRREPVLRRSPGTGAILGAPGATATLERGGDDSRRIGTGDGTVQAGWGGGRASGGPDDGTFRGDSTVATPSQTTDDVDEEPPGTPGGSGRAGP
jgi:NADH-quinone oxidoreductase subunit C